MESMFIRVSSFHTDGNNSQPHFNGPGFDPDVKRFSLFISKLLRVFFNSFLVSIFITSCLISFVSVH